jgi:HK97 family phage major capsid protein
MTKLAELQEKRRDLAQRITELRAAFHKNGEKWADDAQRSAWRQATDAYDLTCYEIVEVKHALSCHGGNDAGDFDYDAQFAREHAAGMGHDVRRTRGRMLGQDDPDDGSTPDDPEDRDDLNREETPRERLDRLRGGNVRRGRGMLFRSDTGKVIRSYVHGENLSRHTDRLSVGRCIRAMILNRLDELTPEEQRAMIGGSESGGGYLLTPGLSRMVIDLARSASVCMRAGAQTVPMETSELHIARLATDPTATWRAEGVAIPASVMTFERITLKAKTIGAIIPISIELIEDAENVGQVIEGAIRAALGLKLDQAALVGTGAAQEPKGIRNHAGVNAVTGIAQLTDYSDVSAAVEKILTANYDGDVSELAWILHPRDAKTLDALEDSTGQPLQRTPWAAALKPFHTTSLPTTEGGGSNESVSIVGAFQQLVIGMRTSGVKIEVLPAGTITDAGGIAHNATDELKVFIRAYLRADVALLRPTWFCNMTGITLA